MENIQKLRSNGNNKRTFRFLPKKNTPKKGFTLLEVLAATGIASIIITSALGTVSSIYFTQKKVQFSQDYFAETRYLMERIAQIFRNNTLDYDRFFVEIGPNNTDCPSFDIRQVPSGAARENDNADPNINKTNRANLTYPNIFYWDTNGDLVQDRNLGGVKPDGTTADPCAEAWDTSKSLTTLYLINSSRTLRTAIRFNSSNNTIEVQRQLGADTDGDGLADIWAPNDANGNGNYNDWGTNSDSLLTWNAGKAQCEIHFDKDGNNLLSSTERFPIVGDKSNPNFCDRGHDWTIISPYSLKINHLSFQPSPSRDPFLNFRVKAAQVHPHVFISIDTELRNPNRYGFSTTKKPSIKFQTMVSSRVFGNIRR